MANSSGFLFMLLLHFMFFNGMSQSHQYIKTAKNQNRLYVFGDSLFDAGNNVFASETSDHYTLRYPYGFTYFANATGRVCDGRVVPDFISEFANLGLLSASFDPEGNFTNGANFACSEAAVLDSSQSEGQLNLMEQMKNFTEMVANMKETFGDVETKDILEKSIYLFSIGGNDYLDFYEEYYVNGTVPTHSVQEAFVENVVGNITSALLEIYLVGGRTFAFQNVGPMGCLPMTKSRFPGLGDKCIELLLEMPKMHNLLLSESLHIMAQNLRGFKYSIFDYYSSLLDRIRNPHAYGLVSGSVACCGYANDPYRSDGCAEENFTICPYPSAYLFFDGGHTTQHTNLHLAQLIWNASEPVTRPYNMRQLFEEVLIRKDDKYII